MKSLRCEHACASHGPGLSEHQDGDREYSQGAFVIDLITAIPLSITGFNPAPMPPEIANRVAAVAVFRNPSARYVGPATAVSPLYGRKAIDLCNSGYRVCTRGGGMSPPQRDEMFSRPHVQYLQSGMPSQAAAFAVRHLG